MGKKACSGAIRPINSLNFSEPHGYVANCWIGSFRAYMDCCINSNHIFSIKARRKKTLSIKDRG